MSLADVTKREMVAADRLAADANNASQGVITDVIISISTLAFASLMRDEGRGAIGEPAADLKDLRNNHPLQRAVDRSMTQMRAIVGLEIRNAIRFGYVNDARWRTDEIAAESDGLHFNIDFDDNELQALNAYPVLGHTADETAAYLERLVRFAIDGVLAMPLNGVIDYKQVPAALGDVARLHAERVANAVREAYFAGVQASAREIGRVLVGG